MKNKIIFFSVLTILCILFLFALGTHGCNPFVPDYYKTAERYEFAVSDDRLLSTVENFKKENPNYCPPSDVINFIDGKDTNMSVSMWHHFYFYFAEENLILYTWVSSVDFKTNTSTFALYHVKNLKNRGSWAINDCIDEKQNKIVINKFEERILKPIEKKLGVSHN